MVIGPGDLLRAGRVIHVERLGPRATAVGRAVDAAGIALPVYVALRGEQHDVGVLRVHQHGRDLFCSVETQVLPCATGVAGLVDAVALGDAARNQVAHADIDDVGVGGCHGDGADGGGFLDR